MSSKSKAVAAIGRRPRATASIVRIGGTGACLVAYVAVLLTGSGASVTEKGDSKQVPRASEAPTIGQGLSPGSGSTTDSGTSNTVAMTRSATSTHFLYGYDLSQQAPVSGGGNKPPAVAAAHQVMASLHGTLDDVALMGWGEPNPEPSPGIYDFSTLAERVDMVEAAGGTPVITLCGAPDWMKGGSPGTTNWSQIGVAPLPDHYADFASLAARVAAAFPTVKYFVVWNELKGFWNAGSDSWNIVGYTNMYNDLYKAIKRVRPDAKVGGPYAPLKTYPTPQTGATSSTLSGSWGTVKQATLDAVSYWLAHKVGADFLAVDGSDVTRQAIVGSPLNSVGKYAALDVWLRAQTSLPIWWVESHIEPRRSGWGEQEEAAVRMAALMEMASSGASVGMQWQPQEQAGWPDLGVWTSTLSANGGKPTPLAGELASALPVLADGVTLVPGEPQGVLVASGAGGTVAVNTTSKRVVATSGSSTFRLAARQVLVS